jgi:hypothetical protein
MLVFQGKISVYCVIDVSFTFLIKYFFLSSARFSVEVSHFLTCGIKAWLNSLGSELNPRYYKSRKLEIFKDCVKEWRAVRE